MAKYSFDTGFDAVRREIKSKVALDVRVATFRGELALHREAGEILRLRSSVLIYQKSLVKSTDAEIIRELGLDPAKVKNFMKHRKAIGRLLDLHGVDPADKLARDFAMTKRAVSAQHRPQLDYVLNTPADKFDPKHLRKLIASADTINPTALQREDRTYSDALASLAEDRKAAKDSQVGNTEESEGEETAADTTDADPTAVILQHIASITALIGEDFDRKTVLSALAGLSTRMMAHAPAVVDTKVA